MIEPNIPGVRVWTTSYQPEEEVHLSRNAPAFAMRAMKRRTLSDPSDGGFGGPS
jgi:hypothetical protein